MIFQQEKDFNKFRQEHPEKRFWQSLLEYTEAEQIKIIKDGKEHDTIYWADVK